LPFTNGIELSEEEFAITFSDKQMIRTHLMLGDLLKPWHYFLQHEKASSTMDLIKNESD
jgi:hypothetical protein